MDTVSLLTHSTSLYLITVLIWGSTWFAITFQLGVVSPEVSIVYRFALASAMLIAYCLVRGSRMRFRLTDHVFFALQGALLFGVNYVVFYYATADMTSGLIAVVFSTIILMNIFLSALFFRQAIELPVVAGAVVGLVGIALVFYPELAAIETAATWRAIALSLLGTLLASLGNMASVRNQLRALPVVQTNAYGMGYGAALVALWAWLGGITFTYDTTVSYSLSLLFLAVFGSIVAFGSYLTLLGRIGAGRAAYAMVLFPIVALAISTLFEGYVWTLPAALGVALVLLGNLLVISRQAAGRALRRFTRRTGGPSTSV